MENVKNNFNKVMTLVDRFICLLMDIFMLLSKALLVVMTLIICISVFFRYVLDTGLSWTDEVAMLFFVWFAFISIAYGVQKKLHISVEFFYGMFNKKVQWVLNKLNNLVVCAIGCLIVANGALLMESTMSNFMTATQWPTAVRYAPVAISGFFMAYFSFIQFIGFEPVKKSKAIKEGETNG